MPSDRCEPAWGRMIWMGIGSGTRSLEVWEALELHRCVWLIVCLKN